MSLQSLDVDFVIVLFVLNISCRFTDSVSGDFQLDTSAFLLARILFTGYQKVLPTASHSYSICDEKSGQSHGHIDL